MSSDRLLYALLHDRAARLALRRRDWDALSASEDDVADLSVIDQAQLEIAARKIRHEVFTRSRRGTGTLRQGFAQTIAAWRRAHPDDVELDELGARFVESEAYSKCRELPFAGAGPSLEESFFRFCEQEGIGERWVRLRELYGALMQSLLLTPEPSYSVPAEIRRTRRGWAAIAGGDTPTLFATVDRRFVSGPVTPMVAALVSGRVKPGGDPVAEATARELTNMGLL